MILKKVDAVSLATCDGIRYRQVGDIFKFDQIRKSGSIRRAKVWIKRALIASSEYRICLINGDIVQGAL
jgi:hypothetical protein